MVKRKLELVCPAGTPAALKVAVNNGADSVYVGFRDKTNARNFPGLNFNAQELKDSAEYAHSNGSQVFVAINTYPTAGEIQLWHDAVDRAVTCGADAVIVADVGLAEYVSSKYPDFRLHLSVQASASSAEAINFYHDRFNVRRVVLPRVLTIEEIAALNSKVKIETEVFVFGGLCVMAEGRCCLSSYVTGISPNRQGACSPASHVKYEDKGDYMESNLGNFTVNRFNKEESAGYPTLCKGRYLVDGEEKYVFEDPMSLNVIEVLPELYKAGVSALKIEGRQRGRAYIEKVVGAFSQAIDNMDNGIASSDASSLNAVAEGQGNTQGSYNKSWQ